MGEVVQSIVSQAGGGQDLVSFIVMMAAMFGILYFMLIRPQRKQQAEHQSLLAGLKKGDEVILSSGIFGKVFSVEDQTVLVEIADRTRIKVLKSAVTSIPATSIPKVAAKASAAGSEGPSAAPATAVPAAGAGTPEKAASKSR